MKLYIFSQQFRHVIKKHSGNYDTYTAFGHNPSDEKPITLWRMDSNGNIETSIVGSSRKIHDQVFKDIFKSRSFGRFDPRTKELSASYENEPSDSEKLWMEELLKEKFGDCEISWFD
jgi:hypothetical protein